MPMCMIPRVIGAGALYFVQFISEASLHYIHPSKDSTWGAAPNPVGIRE